MVVVWWQAAAAAASSSSSSYTSRRSNGSSSSCSNGCNLQFQLKKTMCLIVCLFINQFLHADGSDLNLATIKGVPYQLICFPIKAKKHY
jgi:hypothetical protein